MGISYYPRIGDIFMCDLTDFGPPEMDKVRPAIVVSPRLPNRGEVVTIVPLSTTAPHTVYPYTVLLSKNYHPEEPDEPGVWAKCDMVLNVGRWRLDGFKVGRRKWAYPKASAEDLDLVRKGVLHGLGFGNLLEGK